MTFEEFSPAAIACAIGWMAAGADRQLRDTYFTRWAVAALVEERYTFEFLAEFENEIRRRYQAIGLPDLAPNLATFVAHNKAAALRNALREYRPSETVPSGTLEHKAQEPRCMLTSAPTGGGSATSAPPAIVSRPGDAARAAGRPLYADECVVCRQDPCACRRRRTPMKDGDLVTVNAGPASYREMRPLGTVTRVWCLRKLGTGHRGQSYAQVDWNWPNAIGATLLVGRRTKHFPENLSAVPKTLDSDGAEPGGPTLAK